MSALKDNDGMPLRVILSRDRSFDTAGVWPRLGRRLAAAAQAPGQLTYQRFCISCHSSGVSGAPALGNVVAWAPRIAQGDATLLKHTIDGLPSKGMPPRGMCGACSDQDLLDAIHFMTSRSQ